jgi:hypothetical protein
LSCFFFVLNPLPRSFAEELLQRPVDCEKTIVENGASSILAAKFAGRFRDMTFALNTPIGNLRFDEFRVNDEKLLVEMDLKMVFESVCSDAVSSVRRESILLTGASGFVGAHLLERLTKAGNFVVCLVRSKERFLETMALFGLEASKNCSVLLGDIVDDSLGLSDKDYKTLGTRVRRVIHAAARVDWRLGYGKVWGVGKFCGS